MYKGPRGYIDNLNILFHINYYDGMITGVGDIGGYNVYFEQINSSLMIGKHEQNVKEWNVMSEMWFSYYEPEIDRPDLNDAEDEPGLDYDIIRFYYVYDISKEGMDILLKRQSFFEEYVGEHNKYKNNSRRFPGDKKVEINWEAFQEKTKDLIFDHKKEMIFNNRIGYFDSNSIRRNRK
jgi:hypothetical protein